MTFYYLFSSFLIGFLAASFQGWILSWSIRKEHWFAYIFFYNYPIILIFAVIYTMKGGN